MLPQILPDHQHYEDLLCLHNLEKWDIVTSLVVATLHLDKQGMTAASDPDAEVDEQLPTNGD
jgi:hypothetical protein